MPFLPSDIFINDIFTIWHIYQWHFYHLAFLPMTFLPSDIFTNDIFTIWHIYQWHFYHLAFLPMTFLKVKVQVFYSLISSLKTYHLTSHFTPGHWTCSFVCYFNSPGSIQYCSRFGALNLSHTLPSLSYQVLIFTWVKWSIWGWSALPKDTTS